VDSEFIHSISKVDEAVVKCSVCRVSMKRMLNIGVKMQTPTGHFFEPYMEEDLGDEPVAITSLDHLQSEARKRGLGLRKMPPKPAK
jgi:hypothetical protein